MSGLFATLVSAALGQAPFAEPRPRARFEQDAGDPWAVEQREATPRRVAAMSPSAAPVHSLTGVTERRPEVSQVVTATVPAPLLPAGAPRLPAAAVEAEVKADAFRANAPPYAGTAGFNRGEQNSTEARLPATASTARDADPLSPLLPLTPAGADPVTRGTTGSDAAPARDATVAEAPFVLKVGRIEVRPPPAPSAVPRHDPQAVHTRSVALPRAPVRQSLDDYRAHWKR